MPRRVGNRVERRNRTVAVQIVHRVGVGVVEQVVRANKHLIAHLHSKFEHRNFFVIVLVAGCKFSARIIAFGS